jgi:Cyanate permease
MTRLPRGEGRLLALLGILLLALGMRTATTVFSPVFRMIDADLGLGPVVLGLVGAMPPFAFAVAGSLTPALARRFGAERALLVAITAIVAGQVARAFAESGAVIVVSTAVTMLGLGIGNVLLPALVKRYFPHRVGLLTAIYTTLFAVGSVGPAFVAVPISEAVGWRLPLAAWALTVAFAAVPWIALARGHRTVSVDVVAPVDPDPHVPIFRSPIAWALAAVLWGSAMVGYAGVAWLPLVLTETAGLDDVAAGIHLGILLLPAFPASILVPLVAARPRSAALVVATAGVLGSAGWAGLLFAPAAAPALWVLLAGCGALTFPLVLVQVAVRASTPRVAVRLSAFVQSTGYVAAGTAVLVMGIVHELTHGWVGPLAIILAVGLLPLLVVPIIARPGRVDDPRR